MLITSGQRETLDAIRSYNDDADSPAPIMPGFRGNAKDLMAMGLVETVAPRKAWRRWRITDAGRLRLEDRS